ncbi:TPA: hypothetical protein ACGCW7_003885 [Vibrio cholerae O1]|nr:hypothetical protein [Vibrio cholerae]HBK7910081.1 hypothetical protein [Vibrio cholerae]
MLGFFERLTNPFPDKEPTQPPQGLFAFCLHYSQGMVLPLILMSIATALLAALEVSLFGYMGQLVDWCIFRSKMNTYSGLK